MSNKRKQAVSIGVLGGIAWCIAGSFTPNLAFGQTSPANTETSQKDSGPLEDSVTPLNEITVSSTRSERRIDKVPNTVTVTTSEDIERGGARDIKDLFRNELDVTVRSSATRFSNSGSGNTGRAGNEGVNIRGLEGNQVLMMVDGIRLPNSFSFGPFATGRGDFMELDGIKKVEVLRGPSSIQYGSDGLAGAVTIQTLDPSDLIKADQAMGGFYRTGFASIDRSWSNSLGVAGKVGDWQMMLLGSYRTGHETINKGSNDVRNADRTKPNPVDYNNRYLLGKVFYSLTAAQQIALTVETQNRKQDTEVYSARAVPPLVPSSTIDFDTNDKIERNRVSLEHRFNDLNARFIQRSETRLYWQNAEINQFAAEDRNISVDRTRDNNFSTKLGGVSLLLESNLSGALNQRLTYGGDWSQSQLTSRRSGTVPPFGETFPSKPFPDTNYTLSSGFLQDEIEAGKFSIIPGLRYDHYKLSPSSSGYSGAKVASLSGQAVTPRLGIVWQPVRWFAPYGQYAKGFRAPTPDQVNTGFTNLASGYTSIANPNLKEEKADSFEFGFRGKGEGLGYSVAYFDNRYQDFISSQSVGGAGTPANPTRFQYVNLAKAHIYGAEARSEWKFLDYWKVNLGLAYSRGESEAKGVKTPLDSIQPLKLVSGVRYDAVSWGSNLNFLYSQAKESARISTGTAQFASPSYSVFDLGLYWKPLDGLTVNANLNNIFDTKYWRWSDVSGLASNSAIKDSYTAPGRNAQVSVKFEF